MYDLYLSMLVIMKSLEIIMRYRNNIIIIIAKYDLKYDEFPLILKLCHITFYQINMFVLYSDGVRQFFIAYILKNGILVFEFM